jgi:hypothetical protein
VLNGPAIILPTSIQLKQMINPDPIKRNIDLNLERLKRQYEICIEKYDKASLLDLSHVLRLWVDMQQDVQKHINMNLPLCKFKTYSVKLRRDIPWKDNSYTFCCFPDSVLTRTVLGASFTWGPESEAGTGMIDVDRTSNGLVACKEMFHIETELDDNTFHDIVRNGTGMYLVKKTSFLEWLKAECVRVNYVDADTNELTRKIIPREILIKRIANTLGGSHPEGNEPSSNQFDNAVKNLNAKSIAERPLSYYILIKSAYDILVNFSIIKHKSIYDNDFNRKTWPN